MQTEILGNDVVDKTVEALTAWGLNMATSGSVISARLSRFRGICNETALAARISLRACSSTSLGISQLHIFLIHAM